MRIGPYEVTRELGRGGMGVVYLATHPELGHAVALKVIQVSPPAAAASPAAHAAELAEMRARFLREAQAAARLAGHPHIAGVHDFGELPPESPGAPPTAYLAMRYVPGTTLTDLAESGDCAPAHAARIGAQVARALAHAHREGVLHRDVKPDNILLDAQGDAWLSDFGLARIQRLDEEAAQLTRTGVLLGTPSYMPPEQLDGSGVDARADLFALGASLYDVLAGRPPHGAGTELAVLTRLMREEPPPLRTVMPTVPADLAAVIDRCLARHPGDRFPDAAALADELERFARGEPTHTRPPGVGARVVRAVRRRRAMGLGLTIAAAAAAVLIWYAGDGRDRQSANANLETTRTQAGTAARAAQISACFSRLARDTAGAMRALEAHAFSAAEPDAVVAQHLAAVRDTCTTAARDYPLTTLPHAWLGFAQVLAGDEAAGIAALDAANAQAQGDPLPAVFRAWASLGLYSRELVLPKLKLDGGAARLEAFGESPRLTALREAAGRQLQPAVDAELWRHLTHGRDLAPIAAATAALARRDYDSAAELLPAGEVDPLLEPLVRNLRGLVLYLLDRFDEAAAEWEQLGARGWAAPLLRASEAWIAQSVAHGTSGDAAEQALERAIAAASGAIDTGHRRRAGLATRAQAYRLQCDVLIQRAAPAPARRAVIDGALADFRALEQEFPQVVEPIAEQVELEMLRADLVAPAADTPLRQHYAEALAAADRAGTRDPQHPSALVAAARLQLRLARRLTERGRDPRQAFERSIAASSAVVERTDRDHVMRILRAISRRAYGEWLAARGQEPREQFRGALDDLDHMAANSTGSSDVWMQRAQLQRAWAVWMLQRGEPPDAVRARFAAAAADCEQAIALHPNAVIVIEQSAGVIIGWVQSGAAAPADATARLERAAASVQPALERSPDRASLYETRGVLRNLLAARAGAAGGDPRPALDGAVRDFEQAVRLEPNRSKYRGDLGMTCVARAALRGGVGDAPLAWRRRALDAFDHAIRLNPAAATVRVSRGMLHRWFNSKSAPPDPAQRARHHDAARADFEEAVRINPRLSQGWSALGGLHSDAGRHGAAAEAYDRAYQLRPDLTSLRVWRDRARARAAADGR